MINPKTGVLGKTSLAYSYIVIFSKLAAKTVKMHFQAQ